MSKVTKTGSIWSMSEFTQTILSCSCCPIVIASYDEDSYELAERAQKEGWRLSAEGHVICPACRKKK